MLTNTELTALHIAAQSGHGEVCGLLLSAQADAGSLAPEGRSALHLAAMYGHEVAVRCLLAGVPDAVQWEDQRGLNALHYARARTFPGVMAALQAEEEAQRILKVQWWERFEPDSRACLSERHCEVFLEVGRPWLLGASASTLRLGCRVVDSLGLLARFALELMVSGAQQSLDDGTSEERCAQGRAPDLPASVRIPAQLVRHAQDGRKRRSRGRRDSAIAMRDRPDVELRVALSQALAASGGRLGDLYLRVVGEVDLRAAATEGVACREVRSPWVFPADFAGSPVIT